MKFRDTAALFLSILALFGARKADAVPVDVLSAPAALEISPQAEYLENSTGIETARGIPRSAVWKSWEERRRPGSPFGHGDVWIRFQLKNGSSAPRIILLEFMSTYLDVVEMYAAGESRPSARAGDRLDVDEVTLPHRSPAFRIALPPGTSEWFFHCKSGGALDTLVRIWNEEDFFAQRGRETFLFVIIFTQIGLVIVYSLARSFGSKRKDRLLFALELGAFTTVLLIYNGFFPRIVPGLRPWMMNEGMIMTGFLALGLAVSFGAVYFSWRLSGNLGRASLFLASACFAAGFACLVVPYSVMVVVMAYTYPVIILLLTIAGIATALSGRRGGWVVAAGFAILFCGLLAQTVSDFGIVSPAFWNQNGILLGTAGHALVIAFGEGVRWPEKRTAE